MPSVAANKSGRKNEDLRDIYNNAYEGNKKYSGEAESFFTFPTDDITDFLVENVNFADKTVLEVGCGTGETALAIAGKGAKEVLAIDYAEEAINTCQSRHKAPNLRFETRDYKELDAKYDIIVLQEVIEHLDEPMEAIDILMQHVKPGGELVLTCPNFTNLRGYIWMTLQVLLDVPMSLTDVHFFSPFDFEEVAEKSGYDLTWTTFAHDRIYTEKLIVDMRKRLTNALRDAELDNSKVDVFMTWLEKVLTIDYQSTEINGGKGFYVFKHKDAA